MASDLYDTSTPAGRSMEAKYGGKHTSPLEDLWAGYSGKNQRGFEQPQYKSMRPDEERMLRMQSRDAQGAFGGLLQAQMRGQGPSLAQMQLAQGRDAAIRSQTAAAASGRGTNVALANRTAAQQGGRMGMQAARDSALIRSQEQMAAQQQYGGLLQAQQLADLQARGLSIDEAKAQLAAESQYVGGIMKVGEGEAERRQKGYGGIATAFGAMVPSDIRTKTGVMPANYVMSPPAAKQDIQPVGYNRDELFGRQFGQQSVDPYAQAGFQAGMQPGGMQPMGGGMDVMQGIRPAANSYEDQYWKQKLEAEKPKEPTAAGAAGGFFAGLGTVSDPSLKDNSAPIGESLGRAAAAVQPYQFRYRPEAAASQGVTTEQRVGVMANDAPGNLEENPVYKPAVRYGPDGLARVDAGQATMANIAVTSDLAREQESIKQDFAELKNLLAAEKAKNTAPQTLAAHRKARGAGGTSPEIEAYRRKKNDKEQFTVGEQFGGRGDPFQPQVLDGGFGLSKRHVPVSRIPPGSDVTLDNPNWAQREAARKNKEAEDQGRPWDGGWQGVEDPKGLKTGGFAKPRTAFKPENAEHEERTPGRAELGASGSENKLGELAAALSQGGAMQKDIITRKKRIQRVSNMLSAGTPRQRNPQLVYDELKSRGANVTKKEVTDAMRDEVEL
jgi:hypothetical protein